MSYEIKNNMDNICLVVDCLPFVVAESELKRLSDRYPYNLHLAVTVVATRTVSEEEIAFDFVPDENSVLPFK